MACYALGRCRICARKHKIDVFGGEEDQHYMIEKANLKLIILNTVCIVCIAKIERYVGRIDPELIFGDRMKEREEICDGRIDVDRSAINSPCVTRNYEIGAIKYEEQIEADEFCTTSIIDRMDVDTHRASDPQSNEKPGEIHAADEKNNNLCIYARRDIAKDAEASIQSRFLHEPSIGESKLEKEALTRLISMLEKRVRKRPRNCLEDDSDRGDNRANPESERTENEDENSLKSSSSSVVSSVNNGEPSAEDPPSPSNKKAGRFMSCDFCKKEFTHAGDLNKHRRKHTGEKPYECGECKRKFAHASNLARHQRVHSGERPFVCPKCDRGFTRRDKLVIHVTGRRCQMEQSKSNAAKPHVAVI